MSEARAFYNDFTGDVASLMTALDESGASPEQDYEAETTTWKFNDKSKIMINNFDVTILEGPIR